MTEEEVKQEMDQSFLKVKPKVEAMTHILMDAFQIGWVEGFNLGVKIGRQ